MGRVERKIESHFSFKREITDFMHIYAKRLLYKYSLTRHLTDKLLSSLKLFKIYLIAFKKSVVKIIFDNFLLTLLEVMEGNRLLSVFFRSTFTLVYYLSKIVFYLILAKVMISIFGRLLEVMFAETESSKLLEFEAEAIFD